MRFPGFIGPTYRLPRSSNVDSQRCINMYPERIQSGTGKEGEVAALFPTPGRRTLLTLAGGALRGLFKASNGQLFAVGGNKLYRISSSWVDTEIGTLDTSEGMVGIEDNGLQVVVVDGTTKLYVWTLATSAFSTKDEDDDFLGADQVASQDGYFIFNKPASGQFYISGLNAVTFDPLDIASSEGRPDNLVAHLSDHRELWLFNEQSTEVFFNSGNADFPFERIQGAFIEHGCAARFSAVKMSNSTFWLGQDDKGAGIVYMARGYDPERISTHAVEQAIQSYSNLSDAVAYCYQQEGHEFYVLNFPSANTTWVYDATNGLWHERVRMVDGVFQRDRANCHAYAHGKHVVGDYATGKIYEMSPDILDDDGYEIPRERTAPHVSSSGKRVTHTCFELDVEAGVGIDGSGQGVDPQAMLQFSDDGGKTWSNERWASIGKIGERKKRARWNRLGLARDRVYRVRVTDPVKVVFLGANIELEGRAS